MLCAETLEWQGQKDLNPRHTVLETVVLPTELFPCVEKEPRLISEALDMICEDYRKGLVENLSDLT